jgi:hypothetical protein
MGVFIEIYRRGGEREREGGGGGGRGGVVQGSGQNMQK